MAHDADKLRRLLEAGRSLVGELDPDAVLDRILEAAREATGARYAALGVLNEERTRLDRFLTVGVDDATHRAIGDLPLGRGVLGELIERPEPLRLTEVGRHPHSYGFPAGHPVMHTFLGVPIMIRGEAWGNLYLAEKPDGDPFSAEDEDAAKILADWAATAIENARLFQSSEARRQQLEHAVRGLEAALDIADAVGNASALDRILELIVKRGRALVDARTVLILLREGDELVVAATAGHATGALGRRLPLSASTSGQVLQQRRALRLADVATRMRISPDQLGVPGARTALLVPMLHQGTGLGVLAAFDRGLDGGAFTAADEQLLRTFAASGASAVAIRRSVEAERLRSAIAAAEQERARWARELHDETLQALGGLRVLLASALRRGNPDRNEQAMRQAITDVELEIENLRAIISDLRPSLLDDLGLMPALQALIDRRSDEGLEIESRLLLPAPGTVALSKTLETTTYRVVQEALTNIVTHAQATRVRVLVELAGGQLVIEVRDNGRGFDTAASTTGFGLAGMRERVFLAGGTLEISSGQPGTLVRAHIDAASGAAAPSLADQFVS